MRPQGITMITYAADGSRELFLDGQPLGHWAKDHPLGQAFEQLLKQLDAMAARVKGLQTQLAETIHTFPLFEPGSRPFVFSGDMHASDQLELLQESGRLFQLQNVLAEVLDPVTGSGRLTVRFEPAAACCLVRSDSRAERRVGRFQRFLQWLFPRRAKAKAAIHVNGEYSK